MKPNKALPCISKRSTGGMGEAIVKFVQPLLKFGPNGDRTFNRVRWR
jgi:hypothetical protein